ncbi:hypothetical protein DNTS_031599 [Danionella cerebrum]|uniref:Neuregulin C-terminal domain-containing protein n=1 Tax=Danionella cerebrum TaxID=2873325 RepID=A0A553QJJ3_9TELE|nr:hypothetical protein DNTS_031599 [Danionella translucida]
MDYGGELSDGELFMCLCSMAVSLSTPVLRSEAEELYQKRVLTITGICVALLVVGIVCVVAYCKTKQEERTWSLERTDSVHSDCQSGALSSSVGTSKCSSPACMEARARRAAYCSYPGATQCSLQYGDSYDSLRDSPHSDRYVSALTTPARLSPVDYPFQSSQVPTFQITTPNASHALSLPPAASAIAMATYSPDDDQPLLQRYRRSRRPYYSPDSTGSLPSSPYRFVDDEDYETTQEYMMSSRDQRKKSSSGRRWRRRSRFNGHSPGPRDYSSQSCLSDSEWEDDEVGDLGHGESTPFLSMQNMNATEPATIYRPNDTRTYSNTGRAGSRGNMQANKLSQSRYRPDNAPL